MTLSVLFRKNLYAVADKSAMQRLMVTRSVGAFSGMMVYNSVSSANPLNHETCLYTRQIQKKSKIES